jgi:tape measure domain-containing protein
MAVELERLVARMEADISRFEKGMAKATSVMNSSTRQIDAKMKGIQKTIDNDLTRAASKFGVVIAGAFSLNEIRQAADAFTRVQNSLKVVGLQGDELKSVYDRLFQSAQAQGTSLESTVTLYSRLASAQKELGASQEQLITFTDGVGLALRAAGTDATAASGALLQLGQAMGGGIIQAVEYNSLIDGARPVLQAVAAGLTEAGGSVARLTQLVKDGQVSSKAFFEAFLAGLPDLQAKVATASSTSSQALQRLWNSFNNLVGQITETTGASSGFSSAVGSMATSVDGFAATLNSALLSLQAFNRQAGADLTKGLENAKIGTATTQVAALQAQIESLRKQNPFGVAGGDALRLKGLEQQLEEARRIASSLQNQSRAPAFFSGAEKAADAATLGAVVKPVSIKDYPVPGKGGGAGGGGGGKSSAERTNDFERELEQVRKRIAATEQETASIGKSAFEADRAKTAFELMEAAKQAGLKSTPELTAKINEQAEAEARANEVRRAANEAQQRMVEMQQFVGQSISGFFSDIVSGGRNAEEALMNLVKRLADVVLQAALLGDGPLGSFLGGGKGGLVGSLFSGMGIGARASGGPVSAGRPYLVGERGPELMVPERSGMVIPNAALARAGGGGGGPAVVVNQYFENGATEQALARIAPQMERRMVAVIRDQMSRGKI